MSLSEMVRRKTQAGFVMKSIIKIVMAAIILLLLVFAFLPEPIKVDMQKVKKQNFLITIEGEGKTQIHDIYVVSAPIEGRVTRIERDPGDRVEAGKTVIANMYPANPNFLDKRSETQARADVDGAKAALTLATARVKQAEAELEYDEADYKRTEALYKKNTVSKSSLERAELRLKTLRAELETALSNQKVMVSRLEAAQARLLQPEQNVLKNETQLNSGCQICIYSPVDGYLLRNLHKSESVVSVGTPLVEIGDTSDLEVVIELLSTNAVKVKVGDPALIKRWGGEENIKAEVKLVEPAGFTKISALGVEEQRVNVMLRLIDDKQKWRSLGHAFRVEAAIIIDRVDEGLTVPLSALFRHNESWSVFKVVDDIATLTHVEVGKRNEQWAEIRSGISLSDTIILHPGNAIADGVKVLKR